MNRQKLQHLIKTTRDRVELERLLQYQHYLDTEQRQGPAVASSTKRKQRSKPKRSD